MRRHILALVASLSILAPTQALFAESINILYTGPHLGELEACGCSDGADLGGLQRLASVIDAIRADSSKNGQSKPLLLSTGGLLGSTQPAHVITNRFLLQGMAAIGFDAVALQWQDLIYGEQALSKDGLPWVATNWLNQIPTRGSQAFPAASKLIQNGDLQIGVAAWLAPESSPHRAQDGNHSPISSAIAVLQKKLTVWKKESTFTVVVSSNAGQLLEHISPALVDLVLVPNVDENYLEPAKIKDTWVLTAGTRGQRLGHLTLAADASGAWQMQSHRVYSLDDSILNAKRLDEWYAQYEQALIEDYRNREKNAKAHLVDTPYVGDKLCHLCHAAQKTHWHTTDHANAYQSLMAVNKQFDANCVTCHVVAFGKPGGFFSADSEPDLRNVGCEACHGPAKLHQERGGTSPLKPVTAAVCHHCHDKKHSPDFEFSRYWSKIVHQPKK